MKFPLQPQKFPSVVVIRKAAGSMGSDFGSLSAQPVKHDEPGDLSKPLSMHHYDPQNTSYYGDLGNCDDDKNNANPLDKKGDSASKKSGSTMTRLSFWKSRRKRAWLKASVAKSLSSMNGDSKKPVPQPDLARSSFQSTIGRSSIHSSTENTDIYDGSQEFHCVPMDKMSDTPAVAKSKFPNQLQSSKSTRKWWRRSLSKWKQNAISNEIIEEGSEPLQTQSNSIERRTSQTMVNAWEEIKPIESKSNPSERSAERKLSQTKLDSTEDVKPIQINQTKQGQGERSEESKSIESDSDSKERRDRTERRYSMIPMIEEKKPTQVESNGKGRRHSMFPTIPEQEPAHVESNRVERRYSMIPMMEELNQVESKRMERRYSMIPKREEKPTRSQSKRMERRYSMIPMMEEPNQVESKRMERRYSMIPRREEKPRRSQSKRMERRYSMIPMMEEKPIPTQLMRMERRAQSMGMERRNSMIPRRDEWMQRNSHLNGIQRRNSMIPRRGEWTPVNNKLNGIQRRNSMVLKPKLTNFNGIQRSYSMTRRDEWTPSPTSKSNRTKRESGIVFRNTAQHSYTVDRRQVLGFGGHDSFGNGLVFVVGIMATVLVTALSMMLEDSIKNCPSNGYTNTTFV